MNNITNTEGLESQFGMLLNKRQVARYLNVCYATISNWVTRESLPQIKLCGVVRYDVTAVKEWIAERSNNTSA